MSLTLGLFSQVSQIPKRRILQSITCKGGKSARGFDIQVLERLLFTTVFECGSQLLFSFTSSENLQSSSAQRNIHPIVSKEVWEIGRISDSLNKLCARLVFSFVFTSTSKILGSAFPECFEFLIGNQSSFHCWLKFQLFQVLNQLPRHTAFQLLKVLLPWFHLLFFFFL